MNKQNNDTYLVYLDGLLAELWGFEYLLGIIEKEPRMMDYLNIIAYLRWNEYGHRECKSEVFKAIRILKDIDSKNWG